MEPLHVHVPYHGLDTYYELIRKQRYDLELYFSAAVLDRTTQADIETLIKRLDWAPALTLHAPFMDLNPGADDPLVRTATQARFRQLLDVAEMLKPRAAVFHAGYFKWRYSGQTDGWLKNSIDTWQMVMERASAIKMRVAVENVFDEDPRALQLLIQKINNPDFGFCFDTGHFNLFSTVPLETWFESLGSHLVEVHLHDNDGTADAHQALGQGTIDFEKFFSQMSAKASLPVFTIEAHTTDDVAISLGQVRGLVSKHYRRQEQTSLA